MNFCFNVRIFSVRFYINTCSYSVLYERSGAIFLVLLVGLTTGSPAVRRNTGRLKIFKTLYRSHC